LGSGPLREAMALRERTDLPKVESMGATLATAGTPTGPLTCLECNDQLIVYVIDEGRGCCMGCMNWGTLRHRRVAQASGTRG
jgi:hypothetical protein